ncbi:hypothetical protein K501DRAFT_173355, partial [Backusella circina FSU 941]
QYLQYQVDHQQAFDEINEESNTQRRENNKNDGAEKKKKTYTVYSQIDKFNFIHHMIAKCPKTIAPVARLYNINPRTGQRWWAKYKENPDNFFEIKPRGNVKKLNTDHRDFLVGLFDKDPAATIEDAIEELSANFERIKIGSTAVHDFLKVDMNFTFKRAAFHSEKRNNEENVEERYKWARDISYIFIYKIIIIIIKYF